MLRIVLCLVGVSFGLASITLTSSQTFPPPPPATFYGTISGAETGASVVAFVQKQGRTTTCGSGSVLADGSGHVYTVSVVSQVQRDGCGATGDQVRFYLAPKGPRLGSFATQTGVWGVGGRSLSLAFPPGDLSRRSSLPALGADTNPPPFTGQPIPATSPTPTATPTKTSTPGASATPVGLTFCTVTNVVDGDTIDVSNCADPGRVRLILIDTPEISPGECYGKEASEYTRSRLLNRQVGLEKDVSNKDGFGRNLRYIWIDGQLFNEQIVRDGYAVLATYPPDVKYVERILAAQQSAQVVSAGLWLSCGGVGVPGTPTPMQSATSTPTLSPTPFGTATPTPTASGSCQSASATITGLDKVAEIVTLSGSGNLTGWYLISERGNQRFDFPNNFTLSGSVQIRSGTPFFPNASGQLWWTSANQWNNSDDDDAVLYDCTGQQRSYFDDGD